MGNSNKIIYREWKINSTPTSRTEFKKCIPYQCLTKSFLLLIKKYVMIPFGIDFEILQKNRQIYIGV